MGKPKLNFNNLNTASLAQYAEQILGKMTQESTLFATPVPSLETLENALTAYIAATTEAAFKDTRAIEVRKEKRAALEEVIYELSKYVDTIAKGNRAVILASGFIPSKPNSTRYGIAPKPENIHAASGRVGSGRIQLRVPAWAGANMYQFEFRKKDANTPWQLLISSKSTCAIEGLDSFQEYEFRVAYRGADPTIVYSDVVSCFAV